MSRPMRITTIEPAVEKIEKIADTLDDNSKIWSIYHYTRIIRDEIEAVREEQRRWQRLQRR